MAIGLSIPESQDIPRLGYGPEFKTYSVVHVREKQYQRLRTHAFVVDGMVVYRVDPDELKEMEAEREGMTVEEMDARRRWEYKYEYQEVGEW